MVTFMVISFTVAKPARQLGHAMQIFRCLWTPEPNVVSNKIIVSNILLGLLRLGLGLALAFGSGFILYA